MRLRARLLFGVACFVGCSSPAPGTSTAPPTQRGPSEQGPVDDAKPATTTTAPRPSAPPTARADDPKPPPLDLYEATRLPNFEITLDAEAMALLSQDVGREEGRPWAHGSFRFGDITFADVGVRTKGSATFRPLPKKASLKVKFNKWVKGQKLYGLEGLTLNNQVADPNYLRQRIAYHVFRAAALPASRANNAHVTINGEDYGLYGNIETPDDEFIDRVFGKSVLSLYEAHTPGSWLPGSDDRWPIDIPLPGAPPGTKPDLHRLFEAVAAAKTETLLADLEPYLHTKQWLRFVAAEALTGLFDNYAYSKYTSHNYFMAGDKDGRFQIIPWSTDNSLSDQEGVVDASLPQGDVLFVRCAASPECWSAYKTELRSVLEVFEGLDLVALAHEWHEQIDALALSDPKREDSVDTYKAATEQLYTWLAARPGVVRAQMGLMP